MRTPPSPSEIRIQRLEEENERLRQALDTFKRQSPKSEITFPREWRLHPQGAIVLRLLFLNESVSRERILDNWQSLHASDAQVSVVISRLREKLRPFNVEIEPIYGEGYRLSPPNKARLKEAMGAYADHESRASSSPTPGRAGHCGAVEPPSSRAALSSSLYVGAEP